MPAPPQISVILTTYNRPQYLAEAAESILTQTLRDLELVIVDDASDNPQTALVAADIAASDTRVRVIRRPQNGGPAAARNTGVAESQSPFIAFMDDDDISEPERLEKQVAFLEEHPEIASVVCQEHYINAIGQRIPNKSQPTDAFLSFCVEEANLCACEFIMLIACAVVRRECFDAIGGYRECYHTVEDIDISLRMQEKFTMAEIPEILYCYRQHQGNRISNLQDAWRAKIALIISARRRRISMPDPMESGQLPDDEFLLMHFGELPLAKRTFFIRKFAGPARRLLRASKFTELRNLLALAENLCTSAEEQQTLFRVRIRVVLWSVVFVKLGFWLRRGRAHGR